MVVPIKHTELIISRPILTGAEDLASVLEVKSFGIFGLTDTDGVFISMSYNSGEQRRVAQKRFRCYRKLLLPLVELATPASSQPNSPLYYAAHRLQQRLAVVSNNNTNDFPSQLMRVGLSHDVDDPEDLAKKLIYLSENKDEARDTGEKGKIYGRRYFNFKNTTYPR